MGGVFRRGVVALEKGDDGMIINPGGGTERKDTEHVAGMIARWRDVVEEAIDRVLLTNRRTNMTRLERANAEFVAEIVTRWRKDIEYIRDLCAGESTTATLMCFGIIGNLDLATHTLEMLQQYAQSRS